MTDIGELVVHVVLTLALVGLGVAGVEHLPVEGTVKQYGKAALYVGAALLLSKQVGLI